MTISVVVRDKEREKTDATVSRLLWTVWFDSPRASFAAHSDESAEKH
jgi:hypothetical protein